MDKQLTLWLVIAVYGVFMLAVGILSSRSTRKGSGGVESFTVGGAQRRRLALGLFLWHRLFFRSHVHRLLRGFPAGISACGACWWASETPSLAPCWPGWFWPSAPAG